MKKILVGSLVLLFLVAGCTQSVRTTRLAMPVPEASTIPVNVANYLEKYKGYDGVMLLVDHTIEHSGTMDATDRLLMLMKVTTWDYSEVYQEEYIILNPEASYLTRYYLNYKPDNFYARVVYPDGTIRDFTFADCEKVKDPRGGDIYAVAFPNVSVGTVVKIGYEWSFSVSSFFPPLSHDITLQYPIPCEKVKFTYAYPDWWIIQQKRLGQLQYTPVVNIDKPESKKTLMVYEATDVPALRHEPFSPPFKLAGDYLQFHVTHLKMLGTEWNDMLSWPKFAERFNKYLLKKANATSSQLGKVTDSIVASGITTQDKVKAVLQYVSANIAEDWGAENEGDPSKTLSKKIGSPYDITGLAKAMLEHLGLNSDFLIVHDSRAGFFDGTFVSADQFIVPALRLRMDSSDIVLFPSFKYLPMGMIPEDFQDQPALVVSVGAMGDMWMLPRSGKSNSARTADITVRVDTTGVLFVNDHREFVGFDGYVERRELADQAADTRDKFIRDWIESPGADQTVEYARVLNDSAVYDPLVMEYKYTLNNLVTLTPTEMVIQSAGLFDVLAGSRLPDDTLGRSNPIFIPYENHLERNVTFELPDGWLLATIPDSTHIENEFGSVTSSCEVTPGKVTFHQSLDLYRIQLPKERYGELLTLVGKNGQMALPTVVFTKVTP